MVESGFNLYRKESRFNLYRKGRTFCRFVDCDSPINAGMPPGDLTPKKHVQDKLA